MKHDDLLDITLAAYIDGMLTPELHTAFEKQLLENPAHLDALAVLGRKNDLSDFARVTPVPENLVKKAIEAYPSGTTITDIAVSILDNALKLLSSAPGFTECTPLPSGVRAARIVSPQMIVLRREFDNIGIEVNFEKIIGNQCNLKVILYNSDTGENIGPVRVDLVSQGRLLASAQTAEGEVLFEEISIGLYTVRVSRNSALLAEVVIRIT